MTPKERAAMQPSQQAVAAMRLALDALEELFHSNSTKVAVEKYNTAHNALREALAEPELNLNCKSVQARLATLWGYVKAEQAEQEPVAWFVQYKNRHEFVFGSKPEFIVDGVVEPLYASPVRTKDHCNPLQDLTDDEIRAIRFNWERNEFAIDFARAVIAADREKNK